MIIEKEVDYKVNARSLKYYRDKGYDCHVGDIIKVKIEDLRELSSPIVHYECDGEDCGKVIGLPFRNFTAHHSIYEKTYCVDCANKMRVERENARKMEFLAHDGIKKCSCCNRELPADTDHYFKKHDTKDGFCKQCKECKGSKFTDYLTHIPKEGHIFCKKCGRELPHIYQYFPEDKSCKNGLRNVCRECSNHYKNFLPDDYIPNAHWTDKEDEIMYTNYHDYTGEELQEKFFPDRTIRAIECRADTLGVAWKTQETYERSKIQRGKKLSIIMKGRKMSDEAKQKLSESMKEYYKTHTPWWKGKKRPPEQCKQISERNIRLGKWKGENNPRFINPLSGSDNPNWKGGITNFYQELRSDTKDWFNESMEFCNYSCVVSGLNFDNVHHTTAFKDIVDETFKLVDIDKRNTVSDYTEEEFDNLTEVLKYLHNEYGLGACITKEVHKLFHDNYGYKNFTAYDFLDFVYRIDTGEFDSWFEENNIPININYEYIEYLESTLSGLDMSA